MRQSDLAFANAASAALDNWEGTHGALPGIVELNSRACLIRQLVDSNRRRRYVEHFRTSERLTDNQMDPGHPGFNPYAAAVLQNRNGNLDEALWLVFLLFISVITRERDGA